MGHKQLSAHFANGLVILCLMAKREQCSFVELMRVLGVSRRTLSRNMRNAELAYGVKIEYVRYAKKSKEDLTRGKSGYLHVADWGFVDKHSLIDYVERMIREGYFQ